MKFKKLICSILSLAMLVGILAAMPVSVSADDGTTETKTDAEVNVPEKTANGGFKIDFSKWQDTTTTDGEVAGISHNKPVADTAYTKTAAQSQANLVTDTTLSQKVLEFKAYNKADSDNIMTIPFGTGNAIDTTTGQPFNIIVKMKLPSSNANPPLRGFPILGANDNTTVSTNSDNIFGLAHAAGNKLQAAANNRDDGFWLDKKWDGTNASDLGTDITTLDKCTNNMPVWSSATNKYLTPNYQASLMGTSKTWPDNTWYWYKWEVDTESKSFKVYYSSDGTSWTQAYADKSMINPYLTTSDTDIVRFENGVLPTGALPDSITSFKLRQKNFTGGERVYNIASIEVEYVGSQSIDSSNFAGKVTTTNAWGASEGSATEDSTNKVIVWTNKKTTLTNDCVSQLEWDIDNITLDKKLVEIEFTAKMAGNYYRLEGFPMIIDNEGTMHNFGLQGATPNGYSANVENMIFRNLGTKNINPVMTTNDDTSVGFTKLGLTAPVKTTYGVNGQGTLVGASANFYDFKFVIDPIAKEYRYYEKPESAAVWNEPFKGMPGYPINLNVKLNSNSEALSSISKLRFRIGRNTANNTDSTVTGVVNFKKISVKEVSQSRRVDKSDFASRIVNRYYAIEDGAANSVDITAKIINYTDAAKTGTYIVAVYNEDGVLVSATQSAANVTAGANEVIFEDVPVTGATVSNNKVTADPQIYRIFLWSDDGKLTPLSDLTQM